MQWITFLYKPFLVILYAQTKKSMQMKKLFTLLIALLMAQSIFAQISNETFTSAKTGKRQKLGLYKTLYFTLSHKFSPDGELFCKYIMIQICKSIFCYIELRLISNFANWKICSLY